MPALLAQTLAQTLAQDSGDVTDELSDSADSLLDGFVDALPRIGVALVIIAVGWLLARGLRRVLRRSFRRRHSESFATVMSKLASWLLLGAVVLIAITITFPSVKPVDLLAGLGFFSVAVGFAFQDILENTLSGVLLLFRQPFESGDQIEVGGNEGTVEAITIRETRIRRYDGQLLVVPNRDVYKNAIRVQTDRDLRRVSFGVGVAYEASLDEVRTVIADALGEVEAVAADRPIDAFVTELGASTINLDVRCWVASGQYEAKQALDEMIRTTKAALDAHEIEMPCDIVALQATPSFRAAVHDRAVTPGGSVSSSDSVSGSNER